MYIMYIHNSPCHAVHQSTHGCPGHHVSSHLADNQVWPFWRVKGGDMLVPRRVPSPKLTFCP